jgi:competence protein ComGC
MMSLKGNELGRSIFETLLVLTLISLVVILAIERFNSSAKSLKETALTIELASLRRAVTHYATLERKLPGSLVELASDNIEIPAKGLQGERKIIITGRFVETASRDNEGNPLDPFGGRYGYDPASGKIWSPTPGYKNW